MRQEKPCIQHLRHEHRETTKNDEQKDERKNTSISEQISTTMLRFMSHFSFVYIPPPLHVLLCEACAHLLHINMGFVVDAAG